jgi:hypothetical protein
MVQAGATSHRVAGVAAVALLVAVSGCAAASPSATDLPSASASTSAGSSTGASSSPTLPASPEASPTSSPVTSSTASFSLLPVAQPAEFVSTIACEGPIGPSDSVAIIRLHAAVEGAGELVLRDYSDAASPRTACTFGGERSVEQLIDARHVVIASDGAHAVVDLPEVRFHWFQLPFQPNVTSSTFIAVSPRLDEVAWVSSKLDGTGRQLHLTSMLGDEGGRGSSLSGGPLRHR